MCIMYVKYCNLLSNITTILCNIRKTRRNPEYVQMIKHFEKKGKKKAET